MGTARTFEELVQKISETATEDMPLNRVVQRIRILMLNAKDHDVGMAEVFLNVAKTKYVIYPRTFCQIKLTDTDRQWCG